MRKNSSKLSSAARHTAFEMLETRQMMSGTQLVFFPSVTPYVINGTAGNDSISVSLGGSKPVVLGSAPLSSVIGPIAGGGTTIFDSSVLNVTVNGASWSTTLASGQGVQVNGLNGNDYVTSTGSKGISIDGGAGDDVFKTGTGADYFVGGAGNDTVDYSGRYSNLSLTLDRAANDGGLNERDNISSDVEVLKAGLGNNTIIGDTLASTSTVYTFISSIGNDTIVGGRGNDIINAGAGNDYIGGSFGNDTIHAGAGDDQTSGNDGNDVIYGDTGVDDMYGDKGDDKLYASRGPSFMRGGDGNDTLVSIGGTKIDRQWGGAGTDNFWLDKESTECIMDASAAENSKNTHRVQNFEPLKIGGTNYGSPSRELLGQNFVDPQTTKNSAGVRYGYKSFAGKPLFASGKPIKDDIHQGGIGDCYFLAALSGIAKVSPEVIQRSITELGDGTYGIEMKRDGGNRYIRLDADLPVNSNGNLVYNSLGNGLGSMWAPIMEKAWALFRNSTGTYQGIASGQPNECFKTLGMSNDSYSPTGFFKFDESPTEMGNHIASLMAGGNAVTLCTDDDTSILVSSHCYVVDKVIKTGGNVTSIVLRNPWGTDGNSADSVNDGYITLTIQRAFSGTDHIAWGHA